MSNNDLNNQKFHKIFAILFLVFIISLSAFVLAFPDSEFSDSEKRPLAQFPSLNFTLKHKKFIR